MPNPMLNNNGSYVHNLIFLNKHNAIKSSSFSCLLSNCLALKINDLYFSNGMNVILSRSNDCNLLNSSSESLDFSSISSLCLMNSSFNFSGANSFSELLKKSSVISPVK